ncbi:Hsp20/alpha crystallin family protein [Lachnospiraceae bacterium KGMB03038]|nr:Hsp20/alpha crystallin family protein [Lachnospiraceae bacterium KGMB03038]
MLLANRSFNNLFDDMFNDPFFTRSYDRGSSQIMKTDIHEKDNNYVIEMELPGYAKEEIKADLKDGYLTITAHKNETKEEKDARGKCIHKERYTGTCNRSFYVGEDITQEDIKAAFKDGVLRLQLPKEVEKQADQPQLITIE